MATYTNYKSLEKPLSTEKYNIAVANKNNDVIDSELHKLDLKNQSQDELLATKASLSEHALNKTNPHEVTKSQIGLGNVNNTSDTDKPVSSAQQSAIDAALTQSNYYTDNKIAELNAIAGIQKNGIELPITEDRKVNIIIPEVGLVNKESSGLCPQLDESDNKFLMSDGTWGVPDGKTVECTQAEYDVLPDTKNSDGVLYFITDGEGVNQGGGSGDGSGSVDVTFRDGDVLWWNPDLENENGPISEFPAQTIYFDFPITDYDVIEIFFQYTTDRNYQKSVRFLTNRIEGAYLEFITYINTTLILLRKDLGVSNDTRSISFEDTRDVRVGTTNSNNVNNLYCIPLKIYGYHFKHTVQVSGESDSGASPDIGFVFDGFTNDPAFDKIGTEVAYPVFIDAELSAEPVPDDSEAEAHSISVEVEEGGVSEGEEDIPIEDDGGVTEEYRLNTMYQVSAEDYYYGMIDQLPKEMSLSVRRNTFRGKDLGDTVTNLQKAMIKGGDFKGLFLGDYWTINNVKWRIVDFNYWWGAGNGSTVVKKHHLVIMPDSLPTTYRYSVWDSSSAATGYRGSTLQRYIHGDISSFMNSCGFDINQLLIYPDVLTDQADGSHVWETVTVTAPSQQMLFGYKPFPYASRGNNLLYGPKSETTCFKQLSLFRIMPEYLFYPYIFNSGITAKDNYYWTRDFWKQGTEYIATIVQANHIPNELKIDNTASVRPVFGIIGE